MDYFDCDYFTDTYFDTPDCPPVVVSQGGHRVGRVQLRDPELDEADELMVII